MHTILISDKSSISVAVCTLPTMPASHNLMESMPPWVTNCLSGCRAGAHGRASAAGGIRGAPGAQLQQAQAPFPARGAWRPRCKSASLHAHHSRNEQDLKITKITKISGSCRLSGHTSGIGHNVQGPHSMLCGSPLSCCNLSRGMMVSTAMHARRSGLERCMRAHRHAAVMINSHCSAGWAAGGVHHLSGGGAAEGVGVY